MNTTLREQIRSSILEGAHGDRASISLFGQDIEVRQPSLRDVITMKQGEEDTDAATTFARMLIAYAYVPGSDEKVFEPEDVERLANLPFSDDVRKAADVINEMMGVGVAGEETAQENFDEAQTSETSLQ